MIEKTITSHDLRSALYEKVQEAKQFRPSWVKGIVNLIYPRERENLKMLDISAGWGDRLLTAISLGAEYTGFDPNTALKSGHSKMIQKFGDPKNIKFNIFPLKNPN